MTELIAERAIHHLDECLELRLDWQNLVRSTTTTTTLMIVLVGQSMVTDNGSTDI